ncbi:MAG: hypothetical protein MI725_11855 [Pirellulales bacterium]|nr:hypothetical protein [Pirellulales bacterium]
MDVKTSKSLSAFGFLTVLEDPQHGFFGGYLLLSELGRPLEFHCTTPVVPNRAQEILFGPTLRPYVLGELIGQTLVEKTQLSVQAVLTDQADMMSLALVRSETLVCVEELPMAEGEARFVEQLDSPQLALGSYRLRGTSTCSWSAEQLRAALAPLVSHVDLSEPFQRIREAILEAQRVSNPANDDGHESAAA